MKALQEFGRRLTLDREAAGQEELLIVALDSAQDACLKAAALFQPEGNRWESLCYESILGAGDEEGLEDFAVISRDPEGREILLELRACLDGQSVEAEAEVPFVVYWNCGRDPLAVNGNSIGPDGYMTSRVLTVPETIRAWALQG